MAEHGSDPAADEGAAGLSGVLARNITRLHRRRREEEKAAHPSQRIADRITAWTGSMTFVSVHAIAYGAWIAINLGLVPGLPRFDESFVILAMEASVEAIFLSTFVLISQNRMMAAASKQADLDLQISLLTEHELTRLVTLVEAMAQRLGVESGIEHELEEIKRDVAPEAVLNEIEAQERRTV